MNVKDFLSELGVEFYTGVPDSQLKALCNYLNYTYGVSDKHIIAANEGNATALAAGYHLATGKVALVYLQNSGIGNIINPVTSLLNEKVYNIPCIFVVGWRGEPGIHDEPQHIFQGEITISLLEEVGIHTCVIGEETTIEEFRQSYSKLKTYLKAGKSIAFVVRKNGLFFREKIEYTNKYNMKREEVIENILNVAEGDVIVSTTGKASRELFEIRERMGKGHNSDFLTVGSMGHSSSIALEIAIQKPNTKVWCIDGDGAVLMHMGALAVIGNNKPNNLIHIVVNNESHETVGGMPTVANNIDFATISKACGYENVVSVSDRNSLVNALNKAKDSNELAFIEVKTAIGCRDDLGRPTVSAIDNKEKFMDFIDGLHS